MLRWLIRTSAFAVALVEWAPTIAVPLARLGWLHVRGAWREVRTWSIVVACGVAAFLVRSLARWIEDLYWLAGRKPPRRKLR